jgi:hypothetical protein
MLKKSKPVVWMLICFLAIAMVSLACNLPKGDGSGGSRKLSLDERSENGRISGQYQGTEGQVIEFEVTTDGYATFKANNAPVEESVTVFLGEPGFANMTWGGTTLDGQGVLEDGERVAFDNLMNSELANGMAIIPLDIACLVEDAIDPKQLAALVFPLQMYFKYQVSDRGAEAERLMDLSACDYRNLTENTPHLLFAPSIPIPVVYGYFPFDEKGAIEAPVSMNTGIKTACLDAAPIAPVDRSNAPNPNVGLGGPCGARCRGACGSDCARNNCDYREEKRCEKNATGNNTGMEVNYQIYDCGVHEACIEHDACYDACNETFGCGTWSAAVCRHADSDGCDRIAFDFHGAKNGFAWANGYGPQPMRETFAYEETWTKELNVYKCPPEAIINETPKIEIVIPTEKSEETLVDIDPCDLLPPGGEISTQNETICVAQYSTNPGEKVVQIQPNIYAHDTDTLCNSLLAPSDYHVFMSEVDFGDCGIQAEISYKGEPAPGYTGWQIRYYYEGVSVRVATSQDYPANKGWIYDTAEAIEKAIQASH